MWDNTLKMHAGCIILMEEKTLEADVSVSKNSIIW